MSNSRTYKLSLYSLLLALSLILSFFENAFFPSILPLPGVKAGLSNIVTLFSLYTLSPLATFSILFVRSIVSSIFGGGITALVFSLSGGTLAFLSMLFLKRYNAFSIYGVSILGASFHSIGQIISASLLFFSFSIFMYLPIMLLASIITGITTAFIAQFIIRRTDMYKNKNLRL